MAGTRRANVGQLCKDWMHHLLRQGLVSESAGGAGDLLSMPMRDETSEEDGGVDSGPVQVSHGEPPRCFSGANLMSMARNRDLRLKYEQGLERILGATSAEEAWAIAQESLRGR